ncbi:MAG TPA: sugar transferase, partial [Anaerolineae bacterium]|nr:sugar transferase [Anaerolineae bacterium]
MLRQFSTRRVVGAFLFDWTATQAALAAAALLYTYLPSLPVPVRAGLRALGVLGASVEPPSGTLNWQVGLPIFLLVGILWPIFLVAFGVYDGRRNPNLRRELLNAFLAILLGTVALAGILYLSFRDTPRGIFLAFFLLDLLLLLGARVVWYALKQRNDPQTTGQNPVLVVGAGAVGQDVVAAIRQYAKGDYFILGYVDDDPAKIGPELAGAPVLGSLEDTLGLVAQHRIYDVIMALPLQAHDRMVELSRRLQAAGVRVRVVPDLFALSFPSATLEGFGGIPLIDLGLPGIYGWRRTTKRAFDVLAATCLLVLSSIVMLPLAVLIKLDSKGPILYRQERIGENGRRFKMFKFRSMVVDADSRAHREHVARLIQENVSLQGADGAAKPSLKLQHDPRITRVGRFIRKTSLDELPQLVNVLRGEMSLVGPRPLPPDVMAKYPKEEESFYYLVPPGITGLWQVSGRSNTSFEYHASLNSWYVKNWSLWLDVMILFKTV